MSIMYTWAAKHGVSVEAIADLRAMIGVDSKAASDGLSEEGVQSRVRHSYARMGGALWRNNVGAMMDEKSNRVVRYGLANDSVQMNKSIKSSDLIGIMPVKIAPEMVGRTLGQFCAVECKRSDWVYGATDRERAQLKFGELVMSMGGSFIFTNRGEL